MPAAAAAGWEPAALARAFLEGGARCLQLRAKTLPPGRFLELCDAVVRAASSCGATVIVNDRADLARMCGAAGVHVGQDDLPPDGVRSVLGPDAIVGYSTHTLLQIERAIALPISYIAVGPVYGTRTKDTGYEAVGLGLVTEAVRRAKGRPVVAIGGVTLENMPAVFAAGASAVAVIGDLLVDRDPALRVAAYLRAIEAAGRSPRP